MVIIFVAIIIIGIIVAGIMLAQSSDKSKFYIVLRWLGAVTALGSFFFLPWIVLGPPGSIFKNSGWLAEQTLILDNLKQLPGLDQALASTTALTAQDIWNAMDHSIKGRIMQISENGDLVTGWRLTGLLFETDWANVFIFVLSSVIVIFALITSLLGMVEIPSKFLARPLLVASGFVFVSALTSLPTLDTLGDSNDIFLRMIMSLAESRVASGGGWYCIGLFLIILSNVLENFSSGPISQNESNDEWL